jgi:mRNA interferase MazF
MDIWFAELGEHPGTCVQEGCRPVLVISNDIANGHAETVTVIPMTSKIKRKWLPSHIPLSEEDMLVSQCYHSRFEPSLILLEQITTIDKTAFRTFVGAVRSKEKTEEINKAVAQQLHTVIVEENEPEFAPAEMNDMHTTNSEPGDTRAGDFHAE